MKKENASPLRDVSVALIQKRDIHIPKGPSANAVTFNGPSFARCAFFRSFLVNPSRPLTRNDIVVRCGPSHSVFNESSELHFSLASVPSGDIHATENGCDVQRPRVGMYRYRY